MEVFVYVEDYTLRECLSASLRGVDFRFIDDPKEHSDGLLICFLNEDVRTNDTLIRDSLGCGHSILLLQRYPRIEAARHYLSLGIRGYGNVMMEPLFLHSAIEALRIGMMWLHPEITAKMIEEFTPVRREKSFLELLSEREKEIALLLLEGKTYNHIGLELSIAPRTVKAHAAHIYQKLQVKDRLDFALQYK